MNIWSAIETGIKEIWAHKFRSVLTMFGIILGVCSLVAMSALVKGMENGMREGLVAMGGLEKIQIQQQEDLPLYQQHLADQAPGLTMNDVRALQESAPLVHTITPSIERNGWRRGSRVGYKGKFTRPYLFAGTWPTALEMNEHEMEHGRMFNEVDEKESRSVCVIGTGIRDELFGDPAELGREIIPLGEQITIDGNPFTIVGMFKHYESQRQQRLREQGQTKSNSRGNRDHWAFRVKNRTIYIPLSTMLIKQGGSNTTTNYMTMPRLDSIHVKIDDLSLLNKALQQVRNVLMVTHNGIEDFTFMTQEDWAEEIKVQIKNARISRSIIASICLIVGGIGIMNIMLASISERVREIGIRKSVGATTQNVFFQILIESVVVAVIGGLVGLVVSVGLVQLIAIMTPSDNVPIITLGSMGFAFSCSVCIGILAGMYPAIKASKLHPIQALRFD